MRALAHLRPALAAFILLSSLAVPAARAAESGGPFTGLDLMSATVFQEGQTSFSGVAIRGRMQSPQLRPEIEILPTMEYWQNNASALGFRTTRRDATLGCDLRWMFATERAWQPYLGAGVGIHFLHNAVTSPTQSIEDDTTRGALDALAGVSFGKGEQFGNFIELKFHDLGGFRQLKLNMGFSWNLANRTN